VFNYSYDAGNNLLEVVDSIDGVIKGKKVFNHDGINLVTSLHQFGDGVVNKLVEIRGKDIPALAAP
jgi:hypothetical protein